MVASGEGAVVAAFPKRPSGPFKVLGRFNSSRTPEIIYTVKDHLSLPDDDPKRISCSCPGWRFSIGRYGFHTCKHVEHVKANGRGVVDEMVNNSIIAKTVAHTADDKVTEKVLNPSSAYSAKQVLAEALDDAGVHISDVAFRRLLKKLRPHLVREAKQKKPRRQSKKLNSETTTPNNDEVLRIITLD
jgi:hypothetical protein